MLHHHDNNELEDMCEFTRSLYTREKLIARIEQDAATFRGKIEFPISPSYETVVERCLSWTRIEGKPLESKRTRFLSE